MMPEAIEDYYKQILYACLASGKMSMTQAKSEAMCAVRSYMADMTELDFEIDKIVLVVPTKTEDSTGEE